MKHSFLIPALFAAACVATDEDEPLGETQQAVANYLQTPSWTTAPSCSPPHQVSAAPGEEGLWAAVRVGTTGSNSYQPTKVKLYLRGKSAAAGNWCAGNVSFKVRLFTSTSLGVPGTFLAENTVAASPATPVTQSREVSVAMRVPIIPPNRSVYVAVQMVGDLETDSNYNCVAGCGPQTSGLNWWAQNPSAPYDWVSLASVGIGSMDIAARIEGDVNP